MEVNNCNNDSYQPPPGGNGQPQNSPPGGGGDLGGGGDSLDTTPESCSNYTEDDENNKIKWYRKIDGTCVGVDSSLNIPYFITEGYYNPFESRERPSSDELEKEMRLINDTIYNSNSTKYYDKTSDTAQTKSFKIHNKSIKVAIGILFSVLIILVIYLVIKLFGLLK